MVESSMVESFVYFERFQLVILVVHLRYFISLVVFEGKVTAKPTSRGIKRKTISYRTDFTV